MPLNHTNFAYAMKQMWPQSRASKLMYMDNPLLALMPKKEDMGGETTNLAVKYADPQGRSAIFTTAQANKGNHLGVKFALTFPEDHSLASITHRVLEQTKGNDKALLDAYDAEFEGAFNTLVRSQAIKLYGSGSGKIGRIAASGGISGSTITLSDPNDITNFEKGMVIELSSADGGGALRSGTLTIATVNRDVGSFTTTVAVTTGIAAAVVSDYIFQAGDYDAAMKGLEAWLPPTVTSSLFFGVDRTADSTRLGGCRFDGSAYTITDAIKKGLSRVGKEGGKPDYGFISFEDFSNLELELSTRIQYGEVSLPDINVGFRTIEFTWPKGKIKIMADINCPRSLFYGLQMNTWKLYSMGKVPHVADLDGMKMLREGSAAAYETRLVSYAQPGSESPGYNIRITLPT